jgi:peroxiredoxin
MTSGKTLSLRTMLEAEPVVVIFYRGAWGPVCDKHLSTLRQSLQKVLDKGATVVAIAPETEAAARKMSKANPSFSPRDYRP